MESSCFTDGASFLNEIENLMVFCVRKISRSRSVTCRMAKSVLCSIIEQICKKRLSQDGVLLDKCNVPLRISTKDKASWYLSPEKTHVDFRRVCNLIADSDIPFLVQTKVDSIKDSIITYFRKHSKTQYNCGKRKQ